jgi:hypothetical protein
VAGARPSQEIGVEAAPTKPLTSFVVPEGSRVLHIGPHKTGTTTLQAALWAARDDMREQGVRLIGQSRHESRAAKAVTGRPSAYSDNIPDIGQWHALVRAMRAAPEPRAVVSSEFFAWAEPAAVKRIVEDIGPDRIRIAITLRPLARVLPSMWQQNVQAGFVGSFDTWLANLFRRAPGKPRASFWTIHRHDELIARWADVVGLDRITLIVVDELDRDRILRSFEQLLGLRDGTFVADRDLTNRSLTLPETEAVRAFNVLFNSRGYPKAVHARYMRLGAAQLMKRRVPPPDEARIELPSWALESVAATARVMTERIEALGLPVIGDLASLTIVPEFGTAERDGGERPIPAEVGGVLAMAVLEASGVAREAGSGQGRFEFAEPVEMVRVPTYQVAGVLALRARRTILRRWAALRGRRR